MEPLQQTPLSSWAGCDNRHGVTGRGQGPVRNRGRVCPHPTLAFNLQEFHQLPRPPASWQPARDTRRTGEQERPGGGVLATQGVSGVQVCSGHGLGLPGSPERALSLLILSCAWCVQFDIGSLMGVGEGDRGTDLPMFLFAKFPWCNYTHGGQCQKLPQGRAKHVRGEGKQAEWRAVRGLCSPCPSL